MIRFGIVLTVVIAAMGLLAGGVLANSLLLVYLAIGAAALAAVMLTAGVVIWRDDVFGNPPPAAQGQAVKQVPAEAVGAAAVPGDLAMGPPPTALRARPDRRETVPDAAPAARRETVAASRRAGPATESVPGPRRGREPRSDESAAADDIWPRAGREPAAGSDADLSAWSFFAKPAKPPAAGEAGITEAAARPAVGGLVSEPAAAPAEPADAPSREDHAESQRAPAADAVAGPAADAVAGPAADAVTRPAADAVADPAADAATEPAADDAAPAGHAEDAAPAGDGPAGDRPATRSPDIEVTVVPGITRYHRSECILIRFLGPEDLETMTRQAAEAASYVACKACRPEQELAGD